MPPIRSDKVKAVRIVAEESESSPNDDWIWSALDTAINAVTTNNLAHIPSVKRIADVFTRMLERLHAIKRNRDDFCAITNEIASLIELAVRYAREHDPVCERFKGVCDNFLTTVSSMQSEMEQILGTPTKRSPKAKAFQTVLSSYQLRKINKAIRQALSLSSPVPSSTGLLSNSREVTISGGTFTDIQGNLNQYIFPNGGTADIQTLLLNDMARKMDGLDFSDYSVLKYGDLRAISTPRRRYEGTRPHDVNEQDPFQEYTVVIHNQIMTARTYRGGSALQSFRNDAKMILEYNFRRVTSSLSVKIMPSHVFMKTSASCSAFWRVFFQQSAYPDIPRWCDPSKLRVRWLVSDIYLENVNLYLSESPGFDGFSCTGNSRLLFATSFKGFNSAVFRVVCDLHLTVGSSAGSPAPLHDRLGNVAFFLNP
ncbi:hypothetical protein F5887DRAFT_1080998 [Amanita rubescens]|nr:hypothetical protein F5887DRAFT_1080998 [Amanita rubescens]